jgi:gas vesicle protein
MAWWRRFDASGPGLIHSGQVMRGLITGESSMARESEDPRVVVVERGSGLGAFLWGALLGAGVALLVAPRSGAETRRLLKAKGRELMDVASEKAEELRELMSEGYERSKARVEEGLETARREVNERREAAREVVDAGRAAARSAREELERRLTEARSARARPSPRTPEGESPSD